MESQYIVAGMIIGTCVIVGIIALFSKMNDDDKKDENYASTVLLFPNELHIANRGDKK